MIQSSNECQLQLLTKQEKEACETMIVEELEELEDEKGIEVFTLEVEVEDENYDEESEEEIEGDFSCDKCDKSFEKEAKLLEHMKVHSPRARLFSCITCKRKFTTELLLQRHEIIHSDLISQIKPESFNRCIVCSCADFKDKTELEDHMREHKEAAEHSEVVCQHCNKSFNKFKVLLRHLRTHDENKTHLCTVCHRTFAMGQELIEHLNRHKGFTPHTCSLCNKSYMHISKLKNHMKSHTSEKVRRILVDSKNFFNFCFIL